MRSLCTTGWPKNAARERASRGRLEQPLADEFALGDAARTGEMAAAGVGDELVHHVEARHLVENLDEAAARIALVAEEEQTG
jgi:hypothetical protein